MDEKTDYSTSKKDELASFVEAHPHIEVVDAIFTDLSGTTRGKRVPIRQIHSAYGEGMAMPASVFLLDATGESRDPCGMGISDGDPDARARAVPGTLMPVPWSRRAAAQVMLTFFDQRNEPYRFEPRNVLARVADRFNALGLTPVVAFELEFYLLDPRRGEGGAPRPPAPENVAGLDNAELLSMDQVEMVSELLEAIERACAVQGVPVGPINAEYGSGQYEINLSHVADPLLAADHCALLQRIVKGVAKSRGLDATFMAKPYADGPGSGMHLHLSLIDRDGKNVFDGGGAASALLKHAIGGMMHLLPESMAIFAPNVNSFRRFQPNLFVPVGATWGHDNRSVAFRVPNALNGAWRVEHRVPGADANPYLTLAAILAAVLHGLDEHVDPGEPARGNVSVSRDPRLPINQDRALEQLERSEVLSAYLGEEYIRTYVECKRREADEVNRVISPAEYRWYL